MTTYTSNGSVRGSCGHKHKTIRAAMECAERDNRACKRRGGYSDRTVARSDGEPMTPREESEWSDELDALRCA